MRFPRAAGILLHPTSLPGPDGIGDLGPSAHRFLDWLGAAGVSLWQMLPLGPTGYGNSPYQCFSSFAGNPLLIHVPGVAELPPGDVDYPSVISYKRSLLRRITHDLSVGDAYRAFVAREGWWLEDYALFMALKEAHGGLAWTDWDP